jgi:DNA polymerase
MVKEKYRKAVFIVVYRRTKNIFNKTRISYLILKRKLHWAGWEFPKGGVDGGEKLIESAKRETFEETGQVPVNLIAYKTFGKYKYEQELLDRKGVVGQTFSLFSAELPSKKVKLDPKEHSSYKWVSYERAMKYLTYDNQKKCLSEVNKKIR